LPFYVIKKKSTSPELTGGVPWFLLNERELLLALFAFVDDVGLSRS